MDNPIYLSYMRVKSWLAAIILTTLIISLSVTIVLYFKPLYYLDMQKYDLAEKYGVTEEEIKENYDTLIWYNTLFNDSELEFPTLTMSENGRQHFAEVKKIFLNLQWAGIICLVLLTPILTWAVSRKEWRWVKYTGYLCIGIPAVVGILILFCWDNLFVWFHKLVFRNNFWLFDPSTDPIINFLPDEFFLHCATLIVVLILAAAVLCLNRYKYLQKHPNPMIKEKKKFV